ncbi:unnamed protein product [Caenorhabditis nigoni]
MRITVIKSVLKLLTIFSTLWLFGAQRFVNGNDTFPTAVSKLSKFSRLINGIAFQQSLTNQDIDFDYLFPRILNMGKATPSIIQEMRLGSLKELLEDIKNLPEEIKEDSRTTKMEDRLLQMRSIANTWEGLGKPSGEYGKALESMKMTLEASNFIIVQLKNNIPHLVNYRDTKHYDSVVAAVISVMAKGILDNNHLEYLEVLKNTPLRSFQTHLVQFFEFKTILETVAAFNLDFDEDQKALEGLMDHFEVLNGISAQAKGEFRKIQKIRDVYLSNDENIGKIFEEFKNDQFLNQSINGQSENLEKSMKNLKKVLEKAEDFWKTVKTEKPAELEKIFETIRHFSDIKEFRLSQSSQDALTPETHPPQPPETQEFLQFLRNASELPKKLDEITDLMNILDGMKKDETMKRDLEVLQRVPSDGTPMDTTTEESFNRFFDKIKDIQGLSLKVSEIPKELDDLSGYLEKEEIYKKSSEFKSFMDSLTSNTKGVDLLIYRLREARKSQKIEDFGPVEKSLEALKPKLKDFLEKDQEISKESRTLAGLGSILEHSRIIGTALKVLENVLKEQKLDETKIQSLQSALGKTTVAPEDLENLKGVLEMNKKLENLYSNITSQKLEITSDISSFSVLFQLANPQIGVSFDLSAIRKLLEKLGSNAPEILEILKDLEYLDSLGLHFSQKELKDAEKSMESMIMFFASVSRRFTLPAKQNPQKETNFPEFNIHDLDEEEEEGPAWVTSHPWLFTAILGCLLVILIGVLLNIRSCLRKPKKGAERRRKDVLGTKKEKQKLLDKEKKTEESKEKPKAPDVEKPALRVPEAPRASGKVKIASDKKKIEAAKPVVKVDLPLDVTQLDGAWIFPVITPEIFSTIILEIREKFDKHKNAKLTSAEKFLGWYYADLFFSKYSDASNSEQKIKDLQRIRIPFSKKNRIELKNQKMFEDEWIHGNTITFSNHFQLALVQPPQSASGPDTPNTIGVFWLAVIEHRAQYVIQWTLFKEEKIKLSSFYYPLKPGTVAKFCNGKVWVKCVSVRWEHDYTLAIRKLEIKLPEYEIYTIEHYHYLEWNTKGMPQNLDTVLEICQEFMKNSVGTVFMHCNDGLGISGSVALFMDCVIKLNEKSPRFDPIDSLESIREYREVAVQTPLQFVTGIILFLQYLRNNVKNLNSSDLEQWFDAHISEPSKTMISENWKIEKIDQIKKEMKN